MCSSKYIVVVQNLASRFPAASLVSSTNAEKVIPVPLAEMYETYDNPDNVQPFNSNQMQTFANKDPSSKV